MISILIPVYNEEEILEASALRVHEYMEERKLEHEVVVTSNGSTDQTCVIGRKLAQQYSWFRFFELPEKGVGKAFVKGVNQARGEFLISLDVDLSFEMNFVDYANDLLQYADMVVGSKTMGSQRRSILRVIASQIYIIFTQLLFGLTISDYSIGCKAYRRSSILRALPFLDGWTGYVFELCVFLKIHNFRILQIGVDCNDFRKSHFNLLHEGFFRFWHVYQTWRLIRTGPSWFEETKPKQEVSS